MALTTLDPNTALVVVDLQQGIVHAPYPFVHAIDEVVQRATTLIGAFRQHGLPVVLVNVAGAAPGRTERSRQHEPRAEGWTDFIQELNQQPDDIVITKRSWGAFTHTSLEERLKAIGVTQVVLAGVATGTGVEASARQAYELGFHVTLAVDAMTDMRSEAHAYSIANVFPRLGETGSTQAICELLALRHA